MVSRVFTCFVHCFFQDEAVLSVIIAKVAIPRLTLCVGFSGFVRMGEPPELPGPCFDLHFDRFDGLMFKAENPFENVCTTTGLPSCGSVSFS